MARLAQHALKESAFDGVQDNVVFGAEFKQLSQLLHVIVEEVGGKESCTVLSCLPTCDRERHGWEGPLYCSVLFTFM